MILLNFSNAVSLFQRARIFIEDISGALLFPTLLVLYLSVEIHFFKTIWALLACSTDLSYCSDGAAMSLAPILLPLT